MLLVENAPRGETSQERGKDEARERRKEGAEKKERRRCKKCSLLDLEKNWSATFTMIDQLTSVFKTF